MLSWEVSLYPDLGTLWSEWLHVDEYALLRVVLEWQWPAEGTQCLEERLRHPFNLQLFEIMKAVQIVTHRDWHPKIDQGMGSSCRVTCAGCVGAILDRILQKFKVTALEMCNFSRITAAEFLEVYRGICPDFYVISHSYTLLSFFRFVFFLMCLCPVFYSS